LNFTKKGQKLLILGYEENEDIPKTVGRAKNEAFEPFVSEAGSANVTYS
jgi:hypothetical protein